MSSFEGMRMTEALETFRPKPFAVRKSPLSARNRIGLAQPSLVLVNQLEAPDQAAFDHGDGHELK